MRILCHGHTKEYKKWLRTENRDAYKEDWRCKGHLRQIQLLQAYSYMSSFVWCL